LARRIQDEDKYKIVGGIKYKRCSTCKEFVPITEFSSRAASADGLAYSCKACERKTAKKSYTSKKQKDRAKVRYQENKDAVNEKAKQRYQEKKDEILEKQAEWRKSKKGRVLVNKATARRRARMIEQTPDGRDYTREEIIERDSVNGECICQICLKRIENVDTELQIDHIIPIAAGGSDTKDNVRCTHKKCNLMRPKSGSDIK
jgi:5-methylcytosine-specific restriction endonuclease McrA